MPQSKKICIIGPAHPIRPGGITTFNERLCRAFLDAGYDCSIWSFSLQYPSFLFPGSTQYTKAPAPAGIKIHSVINSINPLNWLKVGRTIKKERPDLVVVRYWIPFMAPCLGAILRVIKNRHTRIVCIADNIKPHEPRPGDKSLTSYFIPPVDRFIVMSQQVMNALRTFTTTKPATLVPHPLYDNFGEKESVLEARQQLKELYGIKLEPGEPLLVFFGLVRKYKGLDMLISALDQAENKHIRLLVAGEFYEEIEPIRDQIKKLDLEKRVILHHRFIVESSVKHFICAADCVVQPYRSATQSGVTPVAYHFEIPMIVTNVGGLPEMVPDGIAGIVCKPDSSSIAKAIDLYFEKGKASFLPGLLEEKKKLSWERMVKELVD